LIGEAIGAAISPEHSRHGARLGKIYAADARMRMGRTHYCKPALTGRAKIVAEAAGPGDEPRVFLASEWRADETELRRWWLVHPPHSAVMCAALMIGHHFSISLF